MVHPRLTQIEERMKKGKDFTLTRSDYLRLTGTDIPQKASYTQKSSAVAKRAKQYGYQITVVPERLVFTKIGEKQENE